MTIDNKIFIEIALLVAAVSVDALLASLALGIDKVKIPVKSAISISTISAVTLLLALILGRLLGGQIQMEWTTMLGFYVLFVLGIIKLGDGAIKWLIRKRKKVHKELNFRILNLNFILTVYADPNQADADKGGVLSVKEAVSLGIALSLDSVAAGVGGGVLAIPILLTAGFAFLAGLITVSAGALAGNHMAKYVGMDFSWVSGILFLLLAFMKLQH